MVGCADDTNDNAFNAPDISSGSQKPVCTTPSCQEVVVGPGGDTTVKDNPLTEKKIDSMVVIVGHDTLTVYDTVYVPQDTALRWIGNSALRITEISPLNMDFLDEEGNDPSWVEIYNAGNTDADLKGYTLVENLKNLRKWVFASDTIKAKSFKVVFCDKKNISAVKSEDKDGRHTRPHTNWKLDKNGGTIFLVDPYNGIRDSVAYPALTAGLSWGIVDGGYWDYFEKPTPEKPNTESKSYEELVPVPDMSGIKSGFYSEAFTLNPPALEEGVKLRCTTNGSEPTENSQEFNSPMKIDHNMAFRCASFKKGALSTKVITRTFFVDEDPVKMPIVAISVDSSFFRQHYIKTSCDAPKGCPDSVGLYADVEVPVHVEYFEKGSSTKGSTWEKDAGISLMGGYSRLNDKKSVSIRLREEYEDGSINYPLFETRKGVNDK